MTTKTMLRLVAVIVLIAVFFVQSATASDGNYLMDAQRDVSNTDNFGTYGVGTSIAQSTTGVVVGSYSLRINTVNTDSTGGAFTNDNAVNASQTYTAAVYLSGTGTCKLSLGEYNSAHSGVGTTDTATITLNATPTRYTITRTFGGTGVYARLRIITASATSTIYANYLAVWQGTGEPTVPTANFTSDVTSGHGSFDINLYDNSTGSPTSWVWEITTSDAIINAILAGNGYNYQTTQNAFIHLEDYSEMEPYTITVKLTATNAAGSNNTTKNNYITAYTPTLPTSAFHASPLSGVRPLTVQFTDDSTGYPSAWQWSWGDETANGTTQNPAHEYASAGTYNVILTASNANGSNSYQRTGYITVTNPTPTPTPAPTPAPTSAPVYQSPIALPTVAPGFTPHRINTTAYDLLINHTVNQSATNFTTLFSGEGVANVMTDLGLPYVTALGGGSRGNALFLFFIVGMLYVLVFWRTRSVFYASCLALVSCPILWVYVPLEFRTGILAIIILGVSGVVYSMIVNTKRE